MHPLSNMNRTRRIALMGLLIALGVATSHLVVIPLGPAKAFPMQHALNVLGGVILGPGPAAVNAILIGLLRNLLGTGTPLAFTGGVFGALLAGWLYRRWCRIPLAMAGELVGTGLIGAVASWPVAVLIMGREAAATTFVALFSLSSGVGALLGGLLAPVLLRALAASGGPGEVPER